MYTFITVTLAVVALLSAFLLCAVILVQNNKGGGGLGAVSGGVSEAVFGATAASALVKITIWLAVIFLASTLLLATVTGRGRRTKSVAETLAVESATVPAQSASDGVLLTEKVEAAKTEAMAAVESAKTEATAAVESAKAEVSAVVENAKSDAATLVEDAKAKAAAVVEGIKVPAAK